MTLEQLQERWREQARILKTNMPDFSDGLAASRDECADALTPFIAREKADMDLIWQLATCLEDHALIPTCAPSCYLCEIAKRARARLKESES